MAENSLVTEEDLADGARLIQLLDEGRFPVTAAFWAYDSALEVWRLIIAAPEHALESSIGAYGVIQTALAHEGLAVTLDRISLISDDNPGITNLRALAASDVQDVVEIPVGRAEIAGRLYDPVLLYRSDALRYEREVISALQRVQPEDAVMRSHGRLNLPIAHQADAQLDNGNRIVIVETKAVARPVSFKDIVQVEIMKTAYERFYGRPVTAIIVSRTDFNESAREAAQRSNILLVHWTGIEDNDEIQRALTQGLASS